MCPLSFETTSNALTNWFMAPLLANTGSDGTVSPSHFSLSGPHRSGAQRTSVRAQPVSNFPRSSVNPARDRSKRLHGAADQSPNARDNPCPLASLTEDAALESQANSNSSPSQQNQATPSHLASVFWPLPPSHPYTSTPRPY